MDEKIYIVMDPGFSMMTQPCPFKTQSRDEDVDHVVKERAREHAEPCNGLFDAHKHPASSTYHL